MAVSVFPLEPSVKVFRVGLLIRDYSGQIVTRGCDLTARKCSQLDSSLHTNDMELSAKNIVSDETERFERSTFGTVETLSKRAAVLAVPFQENDHNFVQLNSTEFGKAQAISQHAAAAVVPWLRVAHLDSTSVVVRHGEDHICGSLGLQNGALGIQVEKGIMDRAINLDRRPRGDEVPLAYSLQKDQGWSYSQAEAVVKTCSSNFRWEIFDVK